MEDDAASFTPGTTIRQAPASAAGRTLELLNRVVRQVTDNHDETIDVVVSDHEENLTSARNAMEGLKRHVSVI